MDFLKSAVASAIAKGPPFPYSFGDKVDVDQSIWTLYNGTRREDGSPCSIFSFDIPANKARLPLARNALKKLRTLRHPGVIKVLDTVETDTYIYIATERVVPLRWHVKRKSLSPETLKWGLYSIARTIKFINGEASSVHGSLKVASIYTSESGEWKLGGFDVLSNVKDDEAIIYTYGSLVPDSNRYMPPELAKSGWDALRKNPHSAVDAYNFGTLISEVFNGDFAGSDQAAQTKGIPPSMHAAYKRLVNANPKARINVGGFMEMGLRSGGFFDTPLIKLTEGIENLGVKSAEERDEFLSDLDQLADDFPEDFFKMKVLPELINSVEFGAGGPKAFGLVMKISGKLSTEDFEVKVMPAVIRLFGNPDRALRVCLLDNLPLMIDKLPQRVVNDKIFPQLVTGFTDIAPVVREQTLKSVLVIISKLSDRTINGELLRYLAKTANDEQPGIRTNTTICLGKIAKNLGASSRAKVLIAAFTRSLRDPFVHARNAALMALAVTAEYFGDDEVANRILPSICPLLLDKEKLVRDQAAKTMDVFLAKIRKAAAAMPDSALPATATGTGAAGSERPRMSTPQPSEVAGWAGWAISSFTNKLAAAAGEIQSASTPPPQAAVNGSDSSSTRAPAPKGLANTATKSPQTASSSASGLHRQAVRSPPVRSPSSSNTPAANVTSNPAPESWFPDDDADAGSGADAFDAAWGDMDDVEDNAAAGTDSGADTFFDALDAPAAKKTGPGTAKRETSTVSGSSSGLSGGAKPFGDEEPDFAGWLAAQQAQKKSGIGGAKALPKGPTKSATTTTGVAAKKPVAAAAVAAKAKTAPAAAKKIDMKVKDADDDDGWGDGW